MSGSRSNWLWGVARFDDISSHFSVDRSPASARLKRSWLQRFRLHQSRLKLSKWTMALLAVLALPVPNCGPNLMFSVVHFLKARRRKIPATTQGRLNSWGSMNGLKFWAPLLTQKTSIKLHNKLCEGHCKAVAARKGCKLSELVQWLRIDS